MSAILSLEELATILGGVKRKQNMYEEVAKAQAQHLMKVLKEQSQFLFVDCARLLTIDETDWQSLWNEVFEVKDA